MFNTKLASPDQSCSIIHHIPSTTPHHIIYTLKSALSIYIYTYNHHSTRHTLCTPLPRACSTAVPVPTPLPTAALTGIAIEEGGMRAEGGGGGSYRRCRPLFPRQMCSHSWASPSTAPPCATCTTTTRCPLSIASCEACGLASGAN